MKKFTKTMLAVAVLASAGAANASLTNGSETGENELFLSVYDPGSDPTSGTTGRTFNLDLNTTYNQVISNPSVLSTINLAGDANWNAFKTGMSTTGVIYTIASGDFVKKGVIATSTTAPLQNDDPAVTFKFVADNINNHAFEINQGLTSGDSSLITDLPAEPFIGQMNHLGLQSNDLWSSVRVNANGNFGSAIDLYKIGIHQELVDDGFGELVLTDMFKNADAIKIGSYTLAGDTLTFSATAVPLPGAIWMFGAGLMGMLRATRRKSA